MAKVKNEENYFLCPPQTRIQKSMKVGPYLFCSVLCPCERCTRIAVSIRLMSSCICAWLTVGSCQLTNKGQMVEPWKNLEKGPWNAYVSLLWVQSPTVLYPVGTGHRSRNRRGGVHTQSRSLSSWARMNFTKSLVMQTCRCARYIRDTRKPIKNASTRILQASRQRADCLWVSIANPGTKHSAKSNSSSHFLLS